MTLDAPTTLKFLQHRGHDISLVTYGATDENVALECNDCFEVIADQEIDEDLEREIEALR